MITPSLEALVSLATALIKTYKFPSAAQRSFNLLTLTVLLNSGKPEPVPESTHTLTSLNQFKSQLLQSYFAVAAFGTNYDVT